MIVLKHFIKSILYNLIIYFLNALSVIKVRLRLKISFISYVYIFYSIRAKHFIALMEKKVSQTHRKWHNSDLAKKVLENLPFEYL